MKVVSVFQTEDGKQFSSKEEAIRHEVELDALTKLRNLLQAAINSEHCRRGNVDNVLRNILLDSVEVRSILSTYARKMPKEQEAAA